MVIDDIKALKKSLAEAHPKARSSHIYEAIAAGLGFKTYAGLLAHCKEGRPIPLTIDGALFDARLDALSERER